MVFGYIYPLQRVSAGLGRSSIPGGTFEEMTEQFLIFLFSWRAAVRHTYFTILTLIKAEGTMSKSKPHVLYEIPSH